ncbi:MAG: peptidase lon domain protein [Mycobacterium sp.]|nr:peptidase lon domain protein [Mycobacterium sp.]
MDDLPLFPLGTVLFPGVVLPLHIFEPRYRELVRRLMDAPEGPGREFGVVGIRQGWEVGDDQVESLYEVGCTAELRQVTGFTDGTFDIVAVGRRRFRLESVRSDAAPFLHGSVDWLPEQACAADEASLLTTSVTSVFAQYLRLLAAGTTGEGDGQGPVIAEQAAEDLEAQVAALPTDPLTLSHLVAASAPLPQDDRQLLLEERSTVNRLRLVLRLLKREATMLRRLGAVPVPLAELRVPLSPN